MSNELQSLLKLNFVITLILGIPLLFFPGTFLSAIDWAPVDPLLSRALGAALLSMSWITFRGIRTENKQAVRLLIEMQTLFCFLSGIGILRQLLLVNYPSMVWGVFGTLVGFAIFWFVAYLWHFSLQ